MISAARRKSCRASAVLDGATDCERERRGVACTSPLRSAPALLDATEWVRAIHRDFTRAGTETRTANAFRTQPRARVELASRAAELSALAVRHTREGGRGGRPGVRLGSHARRLFPPRGRAQPLDARTRGLPFFAHARTSARRWRAARAAAKRPRRRARGKRRALGRCRRELARRMLRHDARPRRALQHARARGRQVGARVTQIGVARVCTRERAAASWTGKRARLVSVAPRVAPPVEVSRRALAWRLL